jgi:hypothetical protein
MAIGWPLKRRDKQKDYLLTYPFGCRVGQSIFCHQSMSSGKKLKMGITGRHAALPGADQGSSLKERQKVTKLATLNSSFMFLLHRKETPA